MQRHRQLLVKHDARPRGNYLVMRTAEFEYRRLLELWIDLRGFPRERLLMKPYCPRRGEQTDTSFSGSLKLYELSEVYYTTTLGNSKFGAEIGYC
jgi:hypothetical protein